MTDEGKKPPRGKRPGGPGRDGARPAAGHPGRKEGARPAGPKRFTGKPGARPAPGEDRRSRDGEGNFAPKRRPDDAGAVEKRPYTKRFGAKPGQTSGERPPRQDHDAARPARRPERAEAAGSGERRFGGDRKFTPRDRDGAGRKSTRDDRPRKPHGDRPPRPGRRERVAGEGADPVRAEDGAGERIAKRLARAGVASRRDAEEMITAGRVSVNGKVLDTPAFVVRGSDRIEVDGKPIPAIERTRLFLFNKPAGLVTTNKDPEGRRTIFDAMPQGLPRLMTVGRLDINTEGLLLLTNDGGLSRVLELPSTGWLRRYRVRVHGKVEPEALVALKDGIAVDGVFYGAIEATLDREQGSNAWLTLGLREGKNREVKNVLGALGLDVTRLIRISYGPFQLGELAEGEVHELRGRHLREQLGERLIEEAGANFDAPILNEFSNKAVGEKPRRDAPQRETGPTPNRKREREGKREDALDRLQTRRGRDEGPRRDGDRPRQAGKGAGKGTFGKGQSFGKGPGAAKGPRAERPVEERKPRTSNVWMAPGARPLGEKKKAELAARTEGKRYAGKPRPQGGGKPTGAGGRPTGRPNAPRGPHSGKPRGKG